MSGTADGDVGGASSDALEFVAARRAALVPGSWRWLHQVHGDAVVTLAPDEPCAGREGDALVSRLPGEPLAVFAADCALVGLASPEGVVAVAHAGWRGLAAGVIEQAAAEMRRLGAGRVLALLGPVVGPECYEFGEDDLAGIERRYGPGVRGRTRDGQAALDLAAGVRAALAGCGVELVATLGGCGGCGPGWYSFRARGDAGRHALVVSSATALAGAP